MTYGWIQTTLKEQDSYIIKQHESREQFHKTTWRETRMFHDLIYNREIISKMKINYSFRVNGIFIYMFDVLIISILSIYLDCIVELVTTISALIFPKFSIINFSCFLFCINSIFWDWFWLLGQFSLAKKSEVLTFKSEMSITFNNWSVGKIMLTILCFNCSVGKLIFTILCFNWSVGKLILTVLYFN